VINLKSLPSALQSWFWCITHRCLRRHARRSAATSRRCDSIIITPSMSIFGRKSRSKEPEEKSKPQGNGTEKTAKPEQRRAPSRNAAPGVSQNAAPLSAAERTAQRAALMAASRKRMNSDNPDYSINGSFSSSKGRSSHPATEKAQPIKSSHKTLVKEQKPAADSNNKKSKGISEVTSQDSKAASFFSGATFSRKSAPPSVHRGSDDKDESRVADRGVLAPKTPALPYDSPTLGYTPGAEDSPPRKSATSQPSADSGYISAPRSSANTSRADSEGTAVQDTRSEVPRVDSGVAPRAVPASISTRRTTHEDKSLVAPPTSKFQAKGGIKSGSYVSKLDPGPTSSDFASRLINFSKPSSEGFGGESSSTPAMPSSQQRDRRISQSDQMNGRGRSTAQKPILSQVAQPLERPQPKYAQSSRSVSSSRSTERPWPYTAQPASPSSFRTAQSSSQPTETARTYTLPANSQAPEQQWKSSTRNSKPPSSESSRFADGATLMALQSNGTSSQRAIDSSSSPVPNINYGNNIISQSPHSSTTTAPNRHTAASTGSDESTRRPTLPPVSAMEGYKVNKRGQILDGEGAAIGELFEGDLIDCVRQKVNADGEVIDEFGSVVGRVRPVRRGGSTAVRYSEESQQSGFQSPVFQRPMFSAPSVRRESAASQMTSMQSPGGAVQQNGFSNGLAAQTVISPLDGQGNTFIAELDGSTEVEAFPIMDQSDIFLPTFGSSQRSQSPSQLMKVELPAIEQRRSSQVSIASEDASGNEPRPKKWASRYFDPGPNDGSSSPAASRRNSKSPAARRTSTMDSQSAARRTSTADLQGGPRRASTMDNQTASRRASQATIPPTPTIPTMPTPIVRTETVSSSPRSVHAPATAAANSNGAYKAILGPTLEDLAEESPSRSLSTTSKGGKSTPNLLADSQRLSVASPTGSSPVGSSRASLQMGSGGSLHPQSARASQYAPMRRSPLSNYGKHRTFLEPATSTTC